MFLFHAHVFHSGKSCQLIYLICFTINITISFSLQLCTALWGGETLYLNLIFILRSAVFCDAPLCLIYANVGSRMIPHPCPRSHMCWVLVLNYKKGLTTKPRAFQTCIKQRTPVECLLHWLSIVSHTYTDLCVQDCALSVTRFVE